MSFQYLCNWVSVFVLSNFYRQIFYILFLVKLSANWHLIGICNKLTNWIYCIHTTFNHKMCQIIYNEQVMQSVTMAIISEFRPEQVKNGSYRDYLRTTCCISSMSTVIQLLPTCSSTTKIQSSQNTVASIYIIVFKYLQTRTRSGLLVQQYMSMERNTNTALIFTSSSCQLAS